MKLRIRFSKFGPVKFVGHLDMMRFFQKAIKASGLPVKYTEGFSPHQVLSFAAPLGVGTQSESEYCDLELTEEENIASYFEPLNEQMCEGLTVRGFYVLPPKAKNAMASVQGASYRIEFKDDEVKEKLAAAVERFGESEEVLYEKETKTGKKTRNLKEAVYEIKEEDGVLKFTCDASSGGNLKPAALLQGLFEPYGTLLNPWDYHLIREEVYTGNEEGKLVPLYDGLEVLIDDGSSIFLCKTFENS